MNARSTITLFALLVSLVPAAWGGQARTNQEAQGAPLKLVLAIQAGPGVLTNASANINSGVLDKIDLRATGFSR
jgi:hypothetical protein